jgi:hypothetical protein
VIILYGTVQKLLHGYPKPYWSADLSLASMCIDVLKYCGDADPLASRFNSVVENYRDTLEARGLEVDLDIDCPSVGIFGPEISADCLFVLPPGTSDLHTISRDLLNLVQRPFQDPRIWAPGGSSLEPVMRETLINAEETMIGAHLEWTWEISHYFREHGIDETNTITRHDFSAFEMVSRLDSSQFAKPGEPSGWTASSQAR